MRPKVDFRLNAIVDVDAIGGDKDLGELALAAARGGATIIQYRDKNSADAGYGRACAAHHARIEGDRCPACRQ